MVELSVQCALVFLCSFALSDIDVDAHHPLWSPVAAVRNESARLDPSDLTAWTNEAVFEAIFGAALAERLAAGCVNLINIIWVYLRQPLATCYFSCSFRKAIDRSIALRNLQFFRVDTVCEAADESGLARQLKLHRPLAQS